MNITDDQVVLLVNSIADRISHLKSSPETKQMFEEMNKKTDTLQKGIESMEHKMDMHVQDFKHFRETMTNSMSNHQKVQDETLSELKKSIDLKAGKWVEGTIKWAALLIVGAVLLSLIETVLKH